MMVDGITFDVGSVSSPIFAMPDASGLVPLSLPEVFLEKQRTIVPQPYSDIQSVKPSAEAVSRFEAAMSESSHPVNLANINTLIERVLSPAIAEPVAPKGAVPLSEEPVVAVKAVTSPAPDVVKAETAPDVVKAGTDPVKAGTDPIPQKVVVAEKGVETPVLPSSRENVSVAEPVAPKGTVPLSEEPVVAVKAVTSPAPDVVKAETAPDVVKAGTDPVKAGTDPIPQKVVVAEKGVETPVLPSSRENVSVAEPVAPKGTGPDKTFDNVAKGTDPIKTPDKIPADPVLAFAKGTVPTSDPVKAGTDPVPQKGVVAENGIETTVSPSLREDVVVAEPVAPKGTVPLSGEPVVAVKVVTDPAPDVVKAGTDPVKVKAGTDPVKVGTDPIPQKVVVAEKGVETPVLPSSRENVSVAEPVAPKVTVPLSGEPVVAVKVLTDPVIAKGIVPGKEIEVVESRSVVDLNETVEVVDEELETTKAQALQAVPVSVAAVAVGDVQVELQAQEVSAVSAASARTEAVVDTVNNLVEAVVSQISVTPSLVQGEGEVRMTLKANVLDGSDIMLSSKDGTLSVVVTPATPEAAQAAAAAMPRLEVALAEHAPAFRQVAVKLVVRKGTADETA